MYLSLCLSACLMSVCFFVYLFVNPYNLIVSHSWSAVSKRGIKTNVQVVTVTLYVHLFVCCLFLCMFVCMYVYLFVQLDCHSLSKPINELSRMNQNKWCCHYNPISPFICNCVGLFVHLSINVYLSVCLFVSLFLVRLQFGCQPLSTVSKRACLEESKQMLLSLQSYLYIFPNTPSYTP